MMRVDPTELGGDADAFAEALRAESLPAAAHYIGTCVYEYPLLAEHRAFDHGPPHPFARQAYGKGLCPEAEAILATTVILSIHETYGNEELRQFARAIRRVAAWMRTRQ